MKAFIITIPGHEGSIQASKNCMESFKKFHKDWPIKVFTAVIPEDNQDIMRKYKLRWNYPWLGEELDIATGLKKRAYQTVNPAARISCALSHWMLWKRCSEEGIPYIILEHDAFFIKHIDNKIDLINFDIVGLNDPRGATRKSGEYFEGIQRASRHSPTKGETLPVPIIDLSLIHI